MKIKKRYWAGAVIGLTLLGIVGVKVPRVVVDFVNDGYTAAQGHDPSRP